MVINDQTVTPSDGAFIAEARVLVRDLFRPRAIVYWPDLLLTMAVGYTGFYLVHRAGLPWEARAGLFVVTGLALYRAAMFIHELVHLRDGLAGFRIGWNALCGVPMLIPSFLYYTHLDHHRPAHYATHKDGEYLPLARGPVWGIVSFLAAGLVTPILAVVRFAVLTPASWMSGKLRELIHKYLSAMVIDPSYARPAPTPRQRKIWRIQEVLCLIYLWALAYLFLSGRAAWSWLLEGYALAVFVMTINSVRTLAAHRYRHLSEEPLSLTGQLLDSINHPQAPLLTEIWAPVGLRFHALHHLFPGLPYHALPAAHRRLMAGLPAASIYRQTNSPSLRASLGELWRDVRAGVEGGSGEVDAKVGTAS